MKLLHILFFLTGVQLLINGAFFSSSLLSALGACLICLFIVTAKRKSHHQTNENLGPGYHQTTSTKETYFAPLALLALIAGGLAYLFLPLTDIYEKTALTVLGMSFFYLILTLFIHGWKATMKNVLGVLFTLLFVLGLGRIALLWNNDYTTKFNTLVSSLSFSTGSNATGDSNTLSGTSVTGTVILSGTTETGATTSGVSTAPAVEGLTYGQLIPYLVEKYSLSAAGKPDVAFANISQNDEWYEAFKAAYYTRFFSASINPNRQASCDNYVVFVGLAQEWPVTYTADDVYTVFWDEAQKRGLLYGCKKGTFVKWANLF